MVSFIGIILGLALFIVLAFRGHNLVLSALASACVMFLLSGINPMDGLMDLYLPGLAGFIRDYFLLFLFGTLLGRLMSDGGSAKRIALSLARLIAKSKTNQKFFCVLLVPTLYFALTYAGISGFVVVFTVLPIAKDLFEQTDTPWRLYCCGGAQTISSAVLTGSLQASNVYAANVCGTSITAAPLLSVIATAVFLLVSLAMLRFTAARVERSGEGFLPSGAGIRQAQVDEGLPEERLPQLLPSLLPLGVILFLAAGLGWDVVTALLLGCLLTIAVCRKNLLPILKQSLSLGASASFGPTVNVAATYAIGAAIKGLAGFAFFESLLSRLPDMAQGAGLGMLAAFIMASVTAPIPAFGQQMLTHFSNAGLSAAMAHRMMLVTSFTSMAPHNAGISNAAAMLHLPYGNCLKIYIIYTYIPGICAFLACLAAIALGVAG